MQADKRLKTCVLGIAFVLVPSLSIERCYVLQFPGSLHLLRSLAQQIAHEVAKAGGEPVIIDGHSVTVAEAEKTIRIKKTIIKIKTTRIRIKTNNNRTKIINNKTSNSKIREK